MLYKIVSTASFTPTGHDKIRQEPELQRVIKKFWDISDPELAIGGRFIGTGRYSSVRLIGGIAVKISSPTSSEQAYETGRRTTPENLVAQYKFLGKLKEHLAIKGCGITVPEQYFVMRSIHNGYLLGQEYMADHQDFATWANTTFEPDDKEAYELAFSSVKTRILQSVQGTVFGPHLNDLRLGRSGMHGGNILIPTGTQPAPDMPFCIIDQPARPVVRI